jgi:hypothetical protein
MSWWTLYLTRQYLRKISPSLRVPPLWPSQDIPGRGKTPIGYKLFLLKNLNYD